MSHTTVIEVPQWRGSGSPTARRLVEGARLLADMAPDARRVRVEVSESLSQTASRVRQALPESGFAFTAGGDCGVELEPVAAARGRHGDGLVVVWFDAHGDLNTPASSPSGAFHGMVLRALTGDGLPELVPSEPLDPRRVVLAGVRDLDPAESSFIAESGMHHLPDPASLVETVAALSPSAVYVHIDLDVLDPTTFSSVGTPAPGGLHPDQLLSLVKGLSDRFEITGLGITEYEPTTPEDQALLTPLVAALVTTCTGKR